jgi:hypothetical protein
MAMRVMHCLAMEFPSLIGWMLATRRHGPMVAFPIVKAMIDVSIEMIRPMIPRSGTDEYAT